MTRLDHTFFSQDTITIARSLLGQRLVRILDDGQRLAGIIVECEAYVGEEDKACHAARGRTTRNAVMYEQAGVAYVYFIYGMYHCLNVVTEQEGLPAAVLIRALEPREGLDQMREYRPGRPDSELTSGPGRLCQALAIDRAFNHSNLCDSPTIFIEQGEPPSDIVSSPRIGITADQLAIERLWRFYAADSPFVSRQRKQRPPTRYEQ